MEPEKINQTPKEEAFDLLLEALRERPAAQPQPQHPQPTPLLPGMENIDIMQILLALRRAAVWIVLAALLGGGISLFYTERYITPLYQASIQMIVNAKETERGTIRSVAEVTSGEQLVATYATVIKSNRVMEQTIKALGLNMSWRSLNGMVTVRPVNETPVINIVVTGTDPEFCRQVVTTISQIAPEMLVEAVEAGSCKVISDADCTGYPISPNVRGNVQKGFLMGGAAAAALVVLLHLLNDRIRSEDQLADLSPMPVLSTIPMANGHTGHYGYHKRGYGYGYSKGGTGNGNE